MPPSYPIINKKMKNLYYILSEPQDFKILAYNYEAALDAGIEMIQLRCKEATPIWINQIGQLNTQLKSKYANFKVILNDYPQWAKIHHFDGVHLGQEDMDVNKARTLLGPEAMIGLTCNKVVHLKVKKDLENVDYIGWGPVFPTLTKKNSLMAHGLDESLGLLGQMELPKTYLIGGIKAEHADCMSDQIGLAVASGLEEEGKFDIKKYKAFCNYEGTDIRR